MFLPEYLEYAERIRKTLYYGRLPSTDRPSLPFTSMSVEKFSEICRQDGLEKLDTRYASAVCFDACVTPCSLIVALLYLDRLRTQNPEYLANTSPSQVFLVATMVASKYLYDDGEEDEVFNDEWATSAALSLMDLNQAEREFLIAIDWNLFVDAEAFLRAFERVEAEVSWREGVKRGHFTYTDLLSLTQTLPSSCTVLTLLNQVLAVCIVGYTAAMVSVVAGTVLAQECSQQISAVMDHLTSLDATSVHNTTLALCPEEPQPGSLPLVDSLHSLADSNESTVQDSDDSIPNLPGLPSHALTTLTTSILLAMSSPSSSLQRHLGKGRSRHPPPAGQVKQERHSRELGEEEEPKVECDPSDIHLTFTTGPYWPPSSYVCRSGLVMSRFALDPPNFDLGLRDELVSGQKEDWVYSNPWVIPWLSWHGAPVYSMIQNFSGIGAPNLGSFKKNEINWLDRLSWMSALLLDLVADLTPDTLSLALPQTPMLSAATAVAQSGPEPVPWVM
ncbi:Protein CNPPD1 [Chionoecetes opilio]|uniref:Protein CNPPD1 n=1 Tax=Chionoecetes opilio TaxID=41210 RepID=A0A8J4Y167_CHIOP|nr:Protein CNPPD1 [Chionoecetes opilio]